MSGELPKTTPPDYFPAVGPSILMEVLALRRRGIATLRSRRRRAIFRRGCRCGGSGGGGRHLLLLLLADRGFAFRDHLSFSLQPMFHGLALRAAFRFPDAMSASCDFLLGRGACV